jgi:hypothetical protein
VAQETFGHPGGTVGRPCHNGGRLFAPPWLTPARAHWLGLAGIWLAVWLTYWPSLSHAARDDQWNFLFENRHEDHLLPLLLGTYSFHRTAENGRGDYPLFRPALYALLACEKALFGHRFVCWQVAGLLAHCGVVTLLLALLLRLDRLGAGGIAPAGPRLRTVVAYGLALFFAVNFAVMELVIYHHLTAYVLFALLELGVMILALDVAAGAQRRWLRIVLAFVLALLAAFTYEIGQFVAVGVGALLGVAAWRDGRSGRGLALLVLFASVLVLYQLADRLDRARHPPRAEDIGLLQVLAGTTPSATIANARRYLVFGTVQPFFPSCVKWWFASRVRVPEPGTVPWHELRPGRLLGASCAVMGALVGLTGLQLLRLDRGRQRRVQVIAALLAAGLLAGHMAIIVLGRMNLREDDPDVLAFNSYYAYLPLAMLMVVLYALWSGSPTVPRPGIERLAGIVQVVLLGGLLIVAHASARKVHAMNVTIAGVHRPLSACLRFLDGLVGEHRAEGRFALAFTPEAELRLRDFEASYKLPDALPQVLYHRWLDDEHPTHVIDLSDGEWKAYPVAEYHKLYPGRRLWKREQRGAPRISWLPAGGTPWRWGPCSWPLSGRTGRRCTTCRTPTSGATCWTPYRTRDSCPCWRTPGRGTAPATSIRATTRCSAPCCSPSWRRRSPSWATATSAGRRAGWPCTPPWSCFSWACCSGCTVPSPVPGRRPTGSACCSATPWRCSSV